MLKKSDLKALYPRAADAHLAAFVKRDNDVLKRFGLKDSASRLHFFLAQIGHESGGLTIVSENLNYSARRLRMVWPTRFADLAAAEPFARNPEKLANKVYAKRMGNGPPESGDGWRYRGRGYIQITGRDGYRKVGDIAELDLVAQPDLAAEPDHALLVACAFWQWKDLNRISDEGDFVRVTRRINGGINGLEDRRGWLDKVRRTLGAAPSSAIELEQADIIELQRALQAAGYTEVGAADGVIGVRTKAAIMRFRQERGLPDGMIDDKLLAALRLTV